MSGLKTDRKVIFMVAMTLAELRDIVAALPVERTEDLRQALKEAEQTATQKIYHIDELIADGATEI